jgi:hypothetical protein
MRTNRQSDNHHHPLRTAPGIAALFEKLRSLIFPNGISREEFKKFLYAVQNVERRSAKDVKSGRPPRFERSLLLSAAAQIRSVLDEETGGRVSLLYFIANCLPALDYPTDVQTALDANKINLDEARSLARINLKNLGERGAATAAGGAKRKPVEIRRELLDSHLKRGGTQKELRQRVNDRINTTPKAQASVVSYQISVMDAAVDVHLEMNESDTDHLLWEEIKALVFLAREIDTGAIGDEMLEEILKDLDALKLRLMKFRRSKVEGEEVD